MPLTKSGGGAVRTAAVDEHAPRDFLPYARANRATLLCVFGSIFAMAVAMNSGMMWFPLALPRAFGIDPTTVGVGLGTAITVAPLIGVAMEPALLKPRGRGDALEPVPGRTAERGVGDAGASLWTSRWCRYPLK